MTKAVFRIQIHIQSQVTGLQQGKAKKKEKKGPQQEAKLKKNIRAP